MKYYRTERSFPSDGEIVTHVMVKGMRGAAPSERDPEIYRATRLDAKAADAAVDEWAENRNVYVLSPDEIAAMQTEPMGAAA